MSRAKQRDMAQKKKDGEAVLFCFPPGYTNDLEFVTCRL